MSDPTEPFSIFTTLRYDPSPTLPEQFPHLPLHLERLHTACSAFSISAPVDLTAPSLLSLLIVTINNTTPATPSALKLKVSISIPPSNEITATATPTPPLPNPRCALYPRALPAPDPASPWRIRVDTQPTPASQYTQFKTSQRAHYDAARRRAGIGAWTDTREVLVWNSEGEVMEGSFTNVYFWRPALGGWVVPKVECGGLEGVLMRWLVREGVVVEAVVRTGEVRRGEWVVMSNGVRGVWGGWVEVAPGEELEV